MPRQPDDSVSNRTGEDVDVPRTIQVAATKVGTAIIITGLVSLLARIKW